MNTLVVAVRKERSSFLYKHLRYDITQDGLLPVGLSSKHEEEWFPVSEEYMICHDFFEHNTEGFYPLDKEDTYITAAGEIAAMGVCLYMSEVLSVPTTSNDTLATHDMIAHTIADVLLYAALHNRYGTILPKIPRIMQGGITKYYNETFYEICDSSLEIFQRLRKEEQLSETDFVMSINRTTIAGWLRWGFAYASRMYPNCINTKIQFKEIHKVISSLSDILRSLSDYKGNAKVDVLIRGGVKFNMKLCINGLSESEFVFLYENRQKKDRSLIYNFKDFTICTPHYNTTKQSKSFNKYKLPKVI